MLCLCVEVALCPLFYTNMTMMMMMWAGECISQRLITAEKHISLCLLRASGRVASQPFSCTVCSLSSKPAVTSWCIHPTQQALRFLLTRPTRLQWTAVRVRWPLIQQNQL